MNILADLFEHYNAPYRHYHNLSHIAYMFEMANKCHVALSECEVYAIWFHDIVFVPGGKDNEVESARYAVEWLCGNTSVSTLKINTVRNIILDTIDHQNKSGFSGNVIDLDLAGLADANVYESNSRKLKKEYLAYNKLSNADAYEKNRKKWIESFLKRKTIFVGFANKEENNTAAKVILFNDLQTIQDGN